METAKPIGLMIRAGARIAQEEVPMLCSLPSVSALGGRCAGLLLPALRHADQNLYIVAQSEVLGDTRLRSAQRTRAPQHHSVLNHPRGARLCRRFRCITPLQTPIPVGSRLVAPTALFGDVPITTDTFS